MQEQLIEGIEQKLTSYLYIYGFESYNILLNIGGLYLLQVFYITIAVQICLLFVVTQSLCKRRESSLAKEGGEPSSNK